MNILLRTCYIAFLLASSGMMRVHAAEIWERTGTFDGVKSGAVISLALAGNGHIFACANTGAPTYQSIDNGTSWKKSSLPSNMYINAFAVRDSLILAASLAGVYRSTNYGATWKLSDSGLTNLTVKSIQFSTNGILFVGTHGGGVFRSEDTGLTWKAASTGLSLLKISALAIIDSSTILAATDGEGMFISTNNGTAWKPITADVRLNSVRSFAVNSTGVVFAGTDQYGMFRSATRGDTWEPLMADITSSVNAILCKGSEVYAATNLNGVFHSTDNGNSWTPDNTGIEGNVSYSLATNALGQVLVGANGGAVYRRVTVNGVDEDAFASQPSINRISAGDNELRITFTVPHVSRVAFSVYSILGEKIASFDAFLTNEKGTHEFRAAENWPRGTYLCRMETPRHSLAQVFQIP